MHTLDNSGNIPTFILKLWKLVNDNATNGLINWSRSGNSFTIKDQGHFAKEILPLYFKHNNMASFIRQLNMYGFRKASNIDHGGLKADVDEVEFYHNFFLKDQEDQLPFIKRKLSGNPSINKSLTSIVKVDDSMHEILNDVESMKGRQDSVDSMLNSMKRENEALWREVAILRQKHMKQQQIVEKLLHFLVSIVRNQMNVGGGSTSTGLSKRKAPLMIDSSNSRKILKTGGGKDLDSSPGSSGPIISDITHLEEASELLGGGGDVGGQSSRRASDSSKQLVSTLSSVKAMSPEEISLLAPLSGAGESSSTAANQLMLSLPNSLLDFDLDEIQSEAQQEQQQEDDIEEACETLSDHFSQGLVTPKITLEDSPIPIISTGSPVSTKHIEEVQPYSSTDLVVPSQSTSSGNCSSALPSMNTDYLTFQTPDYLGGISEHVDGIDEELRWLQQQIGTGLNIDSSIFGIFPNDDQFINTLGVTGGHEASTSSGSLPKAIMDGSGENPMTKVIKLEDPDDQLFGSYDSGNYDSVQYNGELDSETKDILSNVDLDLDPSSF